MSTWGGMGEGLAAGINRRIELDMKERDNRRRQANADREFEFKREQAEAARERADRDFAARQVQAADAAKRADREFEFKREQADIEQSNFNRKMDAAESRQDTENALKQRELAIKEDAQSWADAISEQRVEQFRLANERLDREQRQAQALEDEQKASGRQQLATALYRVTGSGVPTQRISIDGEDGNPQEVDASILPAQQMQQIFGTDGFFRDVANVVAFTDENGRRIAALVRKDGSMQTFSPEQQYDILSAGVSKSFADTAMREQADSRDVGMFARKAAAEAQAKADVANANDMYGRKRIIDAAMAILKDTSGSVSDEQRAAAANALGEIIGSSVGRGGRAVVSPDSKMGREALKRGYKFDQKTGQWYK